MLKPKLQLRKIPIDIFGCEETNKLFYRYDIDDTIVYFTQCRRTGDIYSVSIDLSKQIREICDVFIDIPMDGPYYPKKIEVKMKSNQLNLDAIEAYITRIKYIKVLCDSIMKIFDNQEHLSVYKGNKI